MSSGADEAMLKKVRGLLAVADDERCPEGERDNARTLAAKLQAKHGITEADLAEHEEPGGLFEGLFGGLRWGNTIRADVEAIWADVDALVERTLRDEKGRARAEAVNAIYGRLRTKLGDSTREPDDGTLKARRDEALTDYYLAFVASQRKSYADMERDYDEEDRKASEQWRQEQAYEAVAWRVRADGASLNKNTVAKIVDRVKHSRVWKARHAREAEARKNPCTYCGVAEAIEVQQSYPDKLKGGGYRTISYLGKDHVNAYWDGDRVFPAHPSCYRDAKAASA